MANLQALDQINAFGVELLLDLVLIEELPLFRLEVNKLEAVVLEGKLRLLRSEVFYADAVRNMLPSFLKSCAGICLYDATILDFKVVVQLCRDLVHLHFKIWHNERTVVSSLCSASTGCATAAVAILDR